MTQEEKQLLRKDLCARLPYGVLGHLSSNDAQFPDKELDVVTITSVDANPPAVEFVTLLGNYGVTTLDNIKPYLRPMSSMTKEEKIARDYYCGYKPYYEEEDCGENYLTECDMPDYIDWLNQHHFDYRGLIEKGLALEAKENMYKTE